MPSLRSLDLLFISKKGTGELNDGTQEYFSMLSEVTFDIQRDL